MPAAIPAAIGLGTSLIGGISSALNPRPPSLSPGQSQALNTILPSLTTSATATPQIDPVQQQLMFGQIAQQGNAGANRVTNNLVSRGLGQSGLLARGLVGNSQAVTGAQNSADLALQQQAISQKNTATSQLLQAIGITNTPGQSPAGAFAGGFAPTLAYFAGKGAFNPAAGSGGGGVSTGGGQPTYGSDGNFTTSGGFWSGGS